MDGGRVGSSQGIPTSGVDLRQHLQVQREQTPWRAVQVSDVEVPQDIRHPTPLLHKDHQQQTILWSNAAGMSGPVSMPSMQPNMAPPPHMSSNMPPHLMHSSNLPHMSQSMGHIPPHSSMSPPPIQQGMNLAHSSQAEHMHGFHRDPIPLSIQRSAEEALGLGNGGPGPDTMVDVNIPRPPGKKKRQPKEKGPKKPRKPKVKKPAGVVHTCGKNGPPVERKVPKSKVCECEKCGKAFVSWTNMKIHYTNVHKEESMAVEKVYNTKCPHEGCTKSFFHRKTMLKHLEQDHGVQTEQERYEFESMEAFFDWKEKTETENHVYFVKQRGLRFHKGWYDQHYYCQRDGSARAHVKKGQPERKTTRRAKKGVTKTGIACPAKMSVKYQKGDKKITVLYTKTHSHPINILDTQFHPISKRTIAQLSETFARGVPVLQVHHEINNVVQKILDPNADSSKSQETSKEGDADGEKDGEEGGTEKENEKEAEPEPRPRRRLRNPPRQSEVFIPPVVRILNKRQLQAIKVQADTARVRDACQKLVSVIERSARVRKKLLSHATQTVEDLLEECISVALSPGNSPGKKTSPNSKKKGKGKAKKGGKRRKFFDEVIQEVAEQELIPTAINEVEVEHVRETLVEDVDDNAMETEDNDGVTETEQMEEEETRTATEGIPAEEQTVEIPLTNPSENRGVHLQEALPEEESCVVSLLAQMEGQTAVEFNYKTKETIEQNSEGVRSFEGMRNETIDQNSEGVRSFEGMRNETIEQNSEGVRSFEGMRNDNEAEATQSSSYQVLITEATTSNENQE